MTQWVLKRKAGNESLMAQTLGISPTLARSMINRGINTYSAAMSYLNPTLDGLGDPGLMADMPIARETVLSAIKNRDPIVVFGDYDVDGVTASVILYKCLRSLGAIISYYIPSREEEGFGLNADAVKMLAKDGCKLLITVDNGIAAIDEIRLANAIGLTVVIIDHHEPGYSLDNNGSSNNSSENNGSFNSGSFNNGFDNIDHENNGSGNIIRRENLPSAKAVVDPKRSACPYPFKHLCAAGLAYQFASYVSAVSPIGAPLLDECLALAALATVCDIVELTGENRIIVKNGLDIINTRIPNRGLDALIANRGLSDKTIDTHVLGFVIGPCINAAGRLQSAVLAAQLFTEDDPQTIEKLAKTLADLNEERKSRTEECVVDSLKLLVDKPLDNVLVILDETAHESIAGIAAGRIRDAVNRPVIVLTKASGKGLVKGSARSIPTYNIFDGLNRNIDLLERFGGHAMAAGLTMRRELVELLRNRLNEQSGLTPTDFVNKIYIDVPLAPEKATFELAREMEKMLPFGKGNEQPIFGAKGIECDRVEIIGEKKTTLRFTFYSGGRTIKMICFGKLDQFIEQLLMTHGRAQTESFLISGETSDLLIDALYQISVREYNGNFYLDLKLADFQIHISHN